MKKLLGALILVPSLAWAEVAVELVPGVVQYGNHTTSVELVPGYRQYSGEMRGYSTELVPGVQHYQLTPRDRYPAQPTVQVPPPDLLGRGLVDARKTDRRRIP